MGNRHAPVNKAVTAGARPFAPLYGARCPGLMRETHAPVSRSCLQARFAAARSDDPAEREADQIAERVMRMPSAGQQACPRCVGSGAPCATSKDAKHEPSIQTKYDGLHCDSQVRLAIDPMATLGAGQPLEASTRAFFEPRFGYDFTRVRIHADGAARDSARSIAARAYTFGRHIVFGSGEFAPSTSPGQRLLAHELTHVIQQGAVSRSRFATGAPAAAASDLRLGEAAEAIPTRSPGLVQRAPDDGSSGESIDPTSLAATPDALSGIEFTYMVENVPATVGSLEPLEVGPFLLVPYVDSLEASPAPRVAYYVAYHKESGIHGYYIGPDSVQAFIDSVDQWVAAGAVAYAFGYPNDWNRHSAVSASAFMRGEFGRGLSHFAQAWKAALTDPGWYAHVAIVTSGAVPRVARVPEPPPGRVLPFRVASTPGALQAAELQPRALAATGTEDVAAYAYAPAAALPVSGQVYVFPAAPAVTTPAVSPAAAATAAVEPALAAASAATGPAVVGLTGDATAPQPEAAAGEESRRRVACPPQFVTMSDPQCGNPYGALARLDYTKQASGWWWRETVKKRSNNPLSGLSVDRNPCTPPGFVVHSRTPTQMRNGFVVDEIRNFAQRPSVSCTDTTDQTVSIGRTASEAAAGMCTYYNRQEINVVVTSPPGMPASGHVTTTSHGKSIRCDW